MPEFVLPNVDQGVVAAAAGKGFALDNLPQFPGHARVDSITVRNNSRANLTFQGLPGAPQVGSGDRIDLPVNGRTFSFSPDANVSAGQVMITVKVVW